MSHRIRWAGMWALLVVVLVAACSDSPAGPGQGPDYTPIRVPQPDTDPLTLHDNVVVIDSAVLHLASSPAQIAAGTYRFDVLGSPVPLIEVGDVVAGPEGLGFMGIATSVSYGTQVVVQATQAALSDIIKEGSFSISEPLSLSVRPPAAGSALAPLYSLAPGVSLSGRLFDLTDVDLCEIVKDAKDAGLPVEVCPEWISLTLPSGYVDFTPSIDFDFESQLSLTAPVKSLKSVIRGNLVFDVSAKAVASQEFSIDGEAMLVGIPIPVPLPYGLGAILKVTAVVKLLAGYEANANVQAQVQSGVHLEAGVEVGGEYANSAWTAIWNDTLDVSSKETTWIAQGNGDVRVHVRPEVQLVVGAINGPYAGLEPYLKVYGAVGTEECRVRLTRGLDADVVLTASYAGHSLPALVKKWPGTETELLNIPCPIGHIRVVTTTTGPSPDIDGYTVTLDGSDTLSILNNGSVMYSPLPPTVYSVELSGIADNCTVTNNPREINVSEGDTTVVSFPVVCTDPIPATGAIKVNTSTLGQDDGYSVVVDGDVGGAQPIGINGTVTFESLIAGNHTVELTDFGTSCVVSGDNPRTVAVADIQVKTDFEVACGLTVGVTTTGTELDPDGYNIVVDGGSPTALADINGSLWLDITPGAHSIELTDVADNCAVTGDNPRDVTAPVEEAFEVTCTAPGSVITFIRGYNVWQINPDGTGEQQLTTDGVATAFYSVLNWSPDGTRLAFQRQLNCGVSQGDCTAIFTSDADGSNQVQLTSPVTYTHDQFPRWSPDGTRIVFHRSDPDQSIMVINSDGTNLVEVLAGNGVDQWYSDPSWAPDGRILYVDAYTANGQCYGSIKVIDADGSGSEALSGDLSCSLNYPRFSPDGTKIAFNAKSGGVAVARDIYVMDADGSNITDLTGGAYGSVLAPAWSPDGTQVALPAAQIGSNTHIWLMDVNGGAQVPLTASIPGSGIETVDWRTVP